MQRWPEPADAATKTSGMDAGISDYTSSLRPAIVTHLSATAFCGSPACRQVHWASGTGQNHSEKQVCLRGSASLTPLPRSLPSCCHFCLPHRCGPCDHSSRSPGFRLLGRTGEAGTIHVKTCPPAFQNTWKTVSFRGSFDALDGLVEIFILSIIVASCIGVQQRLFFHDHDMAVNQIAIFSVIVLFSTRARFHLHRHRAKPISPVNRHGRCLR